MRRILTFLAVALATAGGTLWWLHDGDLRSAVVPVIARWDADGLARDAGIAREAPPVPAEAEAGP